MKTITVFACVFLLALSSCKKEYTCTCSSTMSYTSGSFTDIRTGSETRVMKKTKKADANLACASEVYNESTSGPSGYTYKRTTTCVLK